MTEVGAGAYVTGVDSRSDNQIAGTAATAQALRATVPGTLNTTAASIGKAE